jgi:hypothetical protein
VKMAMIGIASRVCLISMRIWFLRYLGCWKVALSKTKM